jgi:hypothetical protein
VPIRAETKKAFEKPTAEQVRLWFVKAGLPQEEAEKFFDFYESNGWKVGRNPMRSFEAAARNWKRNYANGKYTGTGSNKANQPNPRNVGITIGPTDYGAAARRLIDRQAKESEASLVGQVAKVEPPPPALGPATERGLELLRELRKAAE